MPGQEKYKGYKTNVGAFNELLSGGEILNRKRMANNSTNIDAFNELLAKKILNRKRVANNSTNIEAINELLAGGDPEKGDQCNQLQDWGTAFSTAG